MSVVVNTIIKDTLLVIRDELERALQDGLPRRHAEWVSLSNVVDHRGAPFEEAENKIVMSLANIGCEHVTPVELARSPAADSMAPQRIPPMYVDLYIVFMANFLGREYSSGLGAISQTLSFFQQHPLMTRDTAPSLDPRIDRLSFSLVTLELEELNKLMGLMGTQYLPSICFKVRTITFGGEIVDAEGEMVASAVERGSPRSRDS